MKSFLVLALFLLFSSSQTMASDLGSETTLGTGTTQEAITYHGEQAEKKKIDGRFNWELNYTYDAFVLGATSIHPANASPDQSDHTSSFSGGFGYEKSQWEFGLDLNYSNTKEEYLSTLGPTADVGYTFLLAPQTKPKPKKTGQKITPVAEHEDEDDADFVPSLNLKASIGWLDYKEDYTGTVVGRGPLHRSVTRSGETQISQAPVEISTTLTPLEWFDFKIAYTHYSYNKNVNQFLANLDDPRSVAFGASGFGSTLTGFSSKETLFSLNFYLPLDFEINPEYAQAVNASNGDKTNTYHIGVAKTWGESWKTGLAYEENKSTDDDQKLGIFTLSYLF